MGKVDLTPEVLCERIEQQLASDGNFAGTIANSALYMNCGRTPDAFADVAELIEPIVREAVREHEEWLMGEVCDKCGTARSDKIGWNQYGEHFAFSHKCGNTIARAEWLRRNAVTRSR